MENSFTRFEFAWLTVLLCAAVLLYISSKHLSSGWSLIGACGSVPIALVGVLGPYQFRVYRQAKRAERGVCAGCGYTLDQLPEHDDGSGRRAFELVACSECGLWNGRRKTVPPANGVNQVSR
ncbi:MAG: hypothetical protein QM783_17500 [Phycisphaerales bacterium]